jgi:membrane-bound lytic murein transglycosylase D
VERARRHGYVAPSPEEEVPAGTPRTSTAPGQIVTEQVEGKTRVTYTIQEGDSLWSIGQRFGVSVEALRNWNDLSKRARLQLGARLLVWPAPGKEVASTTTAPTPVQASPNESSANPAPPMTPVPPATTAENPVPPESRPKVHQLAAGETLWSVSQKYGIPLEDLKRWNRIRQAKSLKAGQTLSLVSP